MISAKKKIGEFDNEDGKEVGFDDIVNLYTDIKDKFAQQERFLCILGDLCRANRMTIDLENSTKWFYTLAYMYHSEERQFVKDLGMINDIQWKM